jgi:RNA polymerase sigma factor (sigma-70 family)
MSIPLADLDDAALLAHCRRGGQAAWAVLVRRYQRLIYTVARRAGLDADTAADVFQFTFARLLDHLDRVEDDSRLRAWLVTTARRETLRLLQLAHRSAEPMRQAWDDEDGEVNPVDRIADPSPLPEALLDQLQQHDRLRRAVERLDERSRRFVQLAFLQDEALPYSELASRLGMPEGSIGPTRSRCLAKLRALLADDA